MAVSISGGGASGNVNTTESYFVVGHPTVNGVRLTETNFTYSTSGQGSQQASALLYFDSNGNVTLITESGQNFTGSYVALMGTAFVSPFTAFFNYAKAFTGYSTFSSSFHSMGTSTQTFGSLTMPVTTYQATSLAYAGSLASVTLKIGQPPGTNFQLVSYLSYSVASGANQGSFTWQLISATRA